MFKKPEVHKAGPFKQQNKVHKTGRHRSKSQVEVDKKGRVKSVSSTKRAKRELSKLERRNQIKQLRQNKRDSAIALKRGLGGADAPPFFTVVVSFCEFSDPHSVIGLISASAEDLETNTSDQNVVTIVAPRFKQRFAFFVPQHRIYDILDALKIADTVVFIWPSDGELNPENEQLLGAIMSQGLPTHFNVVPSKPKNKAKELDRLLTEKALDSKLFFLDNPPDGMALMRQIGSGKKKRLSLQDRRPHLFSENIERANEKDGVCTLQVSGYVRGPNLNVNGIVHLTGIGDFLMEKIELLPDPNRLRKRNDMDEGPKLLAEADPKQQAELACEVTPDPMDAEQTWPTEEELNDAKAERVKKKVPKGTSNYQASWIVDEEDDEGCSDEDSDDLSSEEMEEPMSDEESIVGPMDEDSSDTMSVSSKVNEKYDDEFDEKEDQEMLERFRKERENEQFPDEVDTPLDTSARIRFQKYRGLKSFRTSPWDTNENLPPEYGRIFQFANYKQTRKRVLKTEQEGAENGWFVRIHVANVPVSAAEGLNKERPLIVYGLLPHEQKITLVNMLLTKRSDCNVSVKSKDKLIFQVGYRRFTAAPIFSQHTNGDKHKFERYMTNEGPVVASVFAPIIFPPASVLVFREGKKGSHQLVATGTVMDLKPSRIVTKRVVLSGHAFKVNKRSTVARFMFHNPEDINWFKPIELRTKYGRRGHIKESLGTHGHMKCIFDGKLNSQDTILMNLYKRVFPKWTYDPVVPQPREMGNGLWTGSSSQSSALEKTGDVPMEN